MLALGTSWESASHCPAELARQWHDVLGIQWVRYLVQTPWINPKRGVFDWTKTDHDIAVFKRAGLKIYFNPYFYSDFMTGGGPWGMPYDSGCFADDASRFRSEAAYCTSPGPLDAAAVHDVGIAVGERYGADIALWSAGIINEPGIQGYWPPSVFNESGNRLGPNVPRLFEEAMLPFIAGVRKSVSHAFFAGPEADSPGFLPELYELTLRTPTRVIDYDTFHGYPDGGDQVESAVRRIGEFAAAFGKRKAPLANTEMGFTPFDAGEPGRIKAYLAEAEKAGLWLVSFHNYWQWFEDGSVLNNTGWQNRDGQMADQLRSYPLSPAGALLHSFAPKVEKHRAAKS